MKFFKNIEDLRDYLDLQRKEGKTIGLVPTMGALHDGHMSLIRESLKLCDLTICSIFVNPTQFNNPQDLAKYPIKTDEDIQLLKEAKCDAVFIPEASEIYPGEKPMLSINFGFLETVMEGQFRPGHFSGVGIVVSKLLNIVQPNTAFFGQKDLQQLAIIKKLVKELSFQTKIVAVPTAREANGLAMSSRNLRLSNEEKSVATNLYLILNELRDAVQNDMSVRVAVEGSKEKLKKIKGFDLDYLEVVNSETLKNVTNLSDAQNISVCAAAYVGDVRIIDNLYLKQED